MDFTLFMPTKVIFGKQCIFENGHLFKEFGKKALIITGKSSGKKSGALDDVIALLKKEEISYCVFDHVMNNPPLENISEGVLFAKKEKADFIIGIGGGSPIDAAKAIAALYTNELQPMDLFSHSLKNASLPIIAIPTTAGTGSEVTPYSVLSVRELKTKKSFSSPYSFPKIAFIDSTYTRSLPDEVTIDTAFDAFSHCMESYLSLKSNHQSELFALEGINAFSKCISAIKNRDFTDDIRDYLMYSSYMGGLAITMTGTNVIHAMGYSMTYFKNISHGHANTLFVGAFLRYNQSTVPEKTEKMLAILGFKDIMQFERFLLSNIKNEVTLSEEEIREYAQLACTQKNINNSPKKVDQSIIENMYSEVVKGV
ncbi:MAG: iron-containing alcohol dehydrogenase [Clostridia bacterium]|nr:iron-containing alcohol dehydrogenase [Clostridia bacterium]